MTEVIERSNGSLCLPTRGDPAHARAIGYRRYWLSCDPGQNDPAGLCLIRDERVPFWDGNRQKLHDRRRAVVWADYLKDTSYSVITQYLMDIMGRPAIKGRVKLSLDSTGLGRPLSDFLIEKQIEHLAITITAGMATSRKGRYLNIAKTVLLGDLANALETGHLVIAHDLPLRDRLMAELEAFTVKTTSAGNSILDSSRSESTGHADVAIAAALALAHSNVGAGFTGEGRLAGYY